MLCCCSLHANCQCRPQTGERLPRSFHLTTLVFSLIWFKFPTYFYSSLNCRLLEITLLNSVGYLLGVLVWFNTFRLTLHCKSKPPTINQNLCSKALSMINGFCLEMHGLISGAMIAEIWAQADRGHTRWAVSCDKSWSHNPAKWGFLLVSQVMKARWLPRWALGWLVAPGRAPSLLPAAGKEQHKGAEEQGPTFLLRAWGWGAAPAVPPLGQGQEGLRESNSI